MLDQWATLTPRPMPQPAACAPHRVRRCHVTATRTFVLCPASVDVPPPVGTAAASAPSIYGKPLYLFGWPFPVPHLEGAVMSSPDEDAPEDEHALEASRAEADGAMQRLFESDGRQEVRFC